MDDLSLEDIIANWLAGEERLCHARAKTCLAKCCLFKKVCVCVCVCVCVVFEGGGRAEHGPTGSSLDFFRVYKKVL